MRNRAIRIALALILAAGLVAAGYQVITLEQRQTAVRTAQDDFETLAVKVGSGLAALQAAQQAYVAAGQGLDYWIQQTSGTLDALSLELVELKSLSSSQESATAVGVISQTVDNFRQLDERVRDYASNGQVLMASDIIFTDGTEMLRGATESLDTARADERGRASRDVASTGQEQAIVLAAAGAGSLLVALLLLVGGSDTRRSAPRSETEAPGEAAGVRVGLALGDIETAAASREVHARAPSRSTVALTDTAALCADLARVLTVDDLPRLLKRSAELLGATGLIVWLTGDDDAPLRPTLTHGYSSQTVRRIGTIPRDADNATAAAFRDASLQTVTGHDDANGAIVAPLITGHGCIGSLAVEVPPDVALDESKQSLARILASQLSLLLAEPASEPQAEPEEIRAQAQG